MFYRLDFMSNAPLKKIAVFGSLWMLVAQLWAQPYGLSSGTAIGSYLNSSLPTTAPNVSATYDVTVAYTNLVFNLPLYLTTCPGTNLMVLIEKNGTIRTFPNRPNAANAEVKTFLDISSRVYNSSDSGMTAIVFHPEFGVPGSTNRGYVYVTYKWRPNPDLGANAAFAYYRLSRFTVPDGTMVADTNSEVVMLQQFDQQEWHDSGNLMFGQDGYLYFGVGDEGGANDQYNVTQVINERLMSGIFRVDVNKNQTNSHPIIRQPFHHPNLPVGWPESFSTNYYVPNDNPFVNTNGSNLEEYYALGFRNPYRFTQDLVTGKIWIGDVGQSTREEVDILSPGKNYQWAFMEGIVAGPKARPATVIGSEQAPLWDYPHNNGDGCIIGGYVYRGTNFPGLVGKYIAADNDSGRIFAVTSTNGITLDSAGQIASMPPGSVYGGTSTIGQDANGELYFVKVGGVGAGQIYTLKAIVTTVPDPVSPLSALGVFTNLNTLTPIPGLHAYTVNSPLWSDNSVKKRWFAVPNDGTHNTAAEQITFAATGEWKFPSGSVFVKQFDLSLNDTNSAITQRIETRLLVVDQNAGVYGLTYKWRADGSDADLLTTGTNANYFITDAGGNTRTQTWSFPSRTDCIVCHNANAGYVLGLKTHQMNCPTTYSETGVADNQLRALGHIGLLGANYNEAQLTNYLKSYSITNASVSLELRARSYLDANCSQCHRPGGVQAYFDARFTTPLPSQNIIQGLTQLFIADTNDRVVVPQDLPHSLAYNRLSRVGQFQMPPLAKNVVDTNALSVIAAWINTLPPGPGVTLTLANTNPLVYTNFAVNVQFTEPVAGVATNKFFVSNGLVTSLTGTNAAYSINITPLAKGLITVQFPQGQVIGLSGGTNYVSNTLQVSYDPLNQFLMTWLPFEENSGFTTADASGNGNNGALQNMLSTAWTNGQSGNALSFNGVNNYVQISNNLGTNFTIMCWVKTTQTFPTVDPTYLGTGIIWSDVPGGALDFILGGTRSAGGVNRLSFFVGGTETSLGGTQEISTGQWMHLAVTRDGVSGVFKIYVNGILDGTATGATGLLKANLGVAIGGNVGDNRYFNGLIDDVRFYSRVLTGAELVAVLPPNIPPTITSIADQTIARNTSAGPLNFTIGDAETPISSLVVSSNSSNVSLVPNTNIVMSGSGANRTVTITPLTNQVGSTTITLGVFDGSVTTTTSFVVNVNGSLMAWYKLDGNALDSSGAGNHGTTNGGVVFVAPKIGTNAASFNGSNSYVQIPVSVRNDFTIAFWAKTTNTAGTAQWFNGQGFVDGDTPGANADFGTALVGNKFGFGVGNPNTTLTATNIINDGQWHHLVATRNSTSGLMTVSVDGVPQGSVTGPTGSRTAPGFLRLGGLQSGAGFFTGTLDDVRLYDYALSSNQIVAIMNTVPMLAAISNRVILAGATLLVTNSATDAEAPAQALTYGLVTPPAGAVINSSNGIFSWRPLIVQGGATYPLVVSVTDNGIPSLAATQNFSVTVNAPVQPGIVSPAISQGKFQMSITGDIGPDYSVLGSSNLVSWTLLKTTNPPALPYLFIDAASTNYPQRFYRVLLGP